MPIAAKLPLVLCLLMVAACAGFGFLASFEPPGFFVWRASYGAIVLACFVSIAWVFTLTHKA